MFIRRLLIAVAAALSLPPPPSRRINRSWWPQPLRRKTPVCSATSCSLLIWLKRPRGIRYEQTLRDIVGVVERLLELLAKANGPWSRRRVCHHRKFFA